MELQATWDSKMLWQQKSLDLSSLSKHFPEGSRIEMAGTNVQNWN